MVQTQARWHKTDMWGWKLLPAVDKKGEYGPGEKPYMELPILSVHKVCRFCCASFG